MHAWPARLCAWSHPQGQYACMPASAHACVHPRSHTRPWSIVRAQGCCTRGNACKSATRALTPAPRACPTSCVLCTPYLGESIVTTPHVLPWSHLQLRRDLKVLTVYKKDFSKREREGRGCRGGEENKKSWVWDEKKSTEEMDGRRGKKDLFQ